MNAPALPVGPVPLEDIRACFEGVIPSTIATVGEDGAPNVTYLSIVAYIDERHVALSRQFFRKTEENTDVNPFAQVQVTDPRSGRIFQLDLRYDHTETRGPLFERMRTRLDAVAAYEGMANVFSLRGVDVCEVLACTMLPCDFPEAEGPRTPSIERLEAFSRRVSEADDLDAILGITLDGCASLLDCHHAFIMLADETGQRLYTVASSGYPSSGTGSELRIGEGLIGLAAERRQTVRVTHMARDLAYAHAGHAGAVPDHAEAALDRSIPLPDLPAGQSLLVTPMLAHRRLAGVLVLQSEAIGAFQAADEWLVGIMANQVAMAIANLGTAEAGPTAGGGRRAAPVRVKYYREDESIFLDDEYLIKGIAGGILWRLLRIHQAEGRSEFSNREIRLDPTLGLPDVKDNLEARLILLRRRLEERCDYLRIEKTGRGRFRLVVSRPLSLIAADDGRAR